MSRRDAGGLNFFKQHLTLFLLPLTSYLLLLTSDFLLLTSDFRLPTSDFRYSLKPQKATLSDSLCAVSLVPPSAGDFISSGYRALQR
jgi:hypothetical protein